MFGNNTLRSFLTAVTLFASGLASASDLALEPCINGDVSPSGAYRSAQLERVANGYQTWADFRPYYLFAVSATYLESPFEAAEDGADDEDADGEALPN